MGESYFACAERETLEETGLRVRAEKLITLTNDFFSSTKHYITIFVLCRRIDDTQEPQVRPVTFVRPRQLLMLRTAHGAREMRVLGVEVLG
jgi:8-oxo-dGTP pyrophosphatase MutT (NUDIX family)